MGKESKIEWTKHTFNPWRGCTKVSEGCKNCYADTQAKRNPRTLGVWGPNGTRVVASESMWSEPVKWNEIAIIEQERHRVFCASMADIFESWEGVIRDSSGKISLNESSVTDATLTLQDLRNRLFQLIDDTSELDWLILTKRPELIEMMLPVYNYHPCITGDCQHESFDECALIRQMIYRDNVWFGTSIENQKTADERIPHIIRVPAKIRFLSVEPLLGPIEFSKINGRSDAIYQLGKPALNGINWVIIGGESGPNSRPCNVEWIRSIVRQCRAVNVPVFVKQLGHVVEWNGIQGGYLDGPSDCWPIESLRRFHSAPGSFRANLKDAKGGDIDEWPEDLRVRQLPTIVEGDRK